MDVEDLRLFTDVVTYGGISEAARRNYMPQQTMSRHIISLERELGHSLFERSTPIALTPAGRIVLKYAYDLLLTVGEMTSEIDRIAPEAGSVVRVRRYETDSFFHLLSRVVETLQKTHPNIKLEFISLNESDVDLVRRGSMDVGFVRKVVGKCDVAAGLSETSFLDDGLFAVQALRSNSFPLAFGVAEGHPLLHMQDPTLADVASFPIAIPSFASNGAIPLAVLELLRRRGLPARIEMVYSKTMLEYYAAADPRSVCLFNERYSVISLASQSKHYMELRASDDEYTVCAAAIRLAQNTGEPLSCVMEELVSADEVLVAESLC